MRMAIGTLMMIISTVAYCAIRHTTHPKILFNIICIMRSCYWVVPEPPVAFGAALIPPAWTHESLKAPHQMPL